MGLFLVLAILALAVCPGQFTTSSLPIDLIDPLAASPWEIGYYSQESQLSVEELNHLSSTHRSSKISSRRFNAGNALHNTVMTTASFNDGHGGSLGNDCLSMLFVFSRSHDFVLRSTGLTFTGQVFYQIKAPSTGACSDRIGSILLGYCSSFFGLAYFAFGYDPVSQRGYSLNFGQSSTCSGAPVSGRYIAAIGYSADASSLPPSSLLCPGEFYTRASYATLFISIGCCL